MSVAYKKNGTEIPITSAIMGGGVEANPVLDGTEVALEGIKIDKIKYKIIGGEASEVAYDNTTSGMTADNVQDAIDEVFQSGNNRKSQLVDKIIAKGGESSTSKTWDDVIDDVDSIPSGGGNATNYEIIYKDDYYIDHLTGEEVYEVGDHCTQFIDLSGYNAIIASHTDAWIYKFYNVFYDSNKNYITNFSVNGTLMITVPNNTRYVRLSTAKTSPIKVIGFNNI